jgi:quinol monooxygenase YgiN
MATILAHIRVHPGMADRFEEIAKTLYRATHELEPNVRRYEYWRGADEHTYYSLISFDSFNAFLAHQTSDHHEAASPPLAEVIDGIRLEWVDPISGASPLLPTNGEALPADADELTSRYARWFAAQVAEWWLPLREE